MNLTPQERRELRDLVEQLVQATEDHAFWLNRVRELSIELHHRLDALLGTSGAEDGDTDEAAVPHQRDTEGGVPWQP
ncbi:hypothetical protein FHX37_3538 [Haloactinospora alba]|uniref:Uncharacterized protein n=1 Tax=Haloactinospora alba TaxID=405555 RepID=A0A543NP17_9ACTN|nr:hypothetical protein [Haloactinospora alba]TQN33516.1 hypothetical protein FHX37_3538 [Haloactinospora alba]